MGNLQPPIDWLLPFISLERDCLNVFMCRSKIYCLGKGHCITLGESSSPIVCPVTHVGRYWSVRSFSNDPFLAVLSSCLKCLNRFSFQFSSHSFRIEAATTASSLGFSLDDPKLVDYWVSDRYKIDVRPELLFK